jgi:hypothetical protein
VGDLVEHEGEYHRYNKADYDKSGVITQGVSSDTPRVLRSEKKVEVAESRPGAPEKTQVYTKAFESDDDTRHRQVVEDEEKNHRRQGHEDKLDVAIEIRIYPTFRHQPYPVLWYCSRKVPKNVLSFKFCTY